MRDSASTKAALAAAKAGGVRLGGQRGRLDRTGRMARKGNASSAIVRHAANAKRNENLLPVIEDLWASGFSTPKQIRWRSQLTRHHCCARRAPSSVQVRRILKNSPGAKLDAQRVTQGSHKTIAA